MGITLDVQLEGRGMEQLQKDLDNYFFWLDKSIFGV